MNHSDISQKSACNPCNKIVVLSDNQYLTYHSNTQQHTRLKINTASTYPYTNLEAGAPYKKCASGDVRHRPCASRLASQLNTLAPHTPEGLGTARIRDKTGTEVRRYIRPVGVVNHGHSPPPNPTVWFRVVQL